VTWFRRLAGIGARAAGDQTGPHPGPALYSEVSGSGPPVVLLHGQPGTGADWQWVVPLLETDFSVIVPDRPGYGRTGGAATGFTGNARAVVGLLDRLGFERAVLVAHSWAGGAALAAAEAFPDRIAGLVLVASVGPGERMAWDDRLLAAPVLGELIAGLAIGGVGMVVGSRRVQSLANQRLAGRARDAVTTLIHMTGGSTRVWKSFVVEQRAMIAELDGLQPGLASIRAPTAILSGSADRLVPAYVGEALEQAIPGATRQLLAGVGHLLPHDRPQAVADAVRLVAGAAPAGGAQTDR
jgi:pimeloyl-ACP methyl ester carboxylesterase